MPTTPASLSLTRRQDAATSSIHRPTYLRKRRSSSLHAHQRHTTLLFSLPSTLSIPPTLRSVSYHHSRQKVWQNFYTIFNWSHSGLVFFRGTLSVCCTFYGSRCFHIHNDVRCISYQCEAQRTLVRVYVSTQMDELRSQPSTHNGQPLVTGRCWLKNFQKLWSPLKILGATRYRKQVPYWCSTNLRHHRTQFSRPGNLAPRICAQPQPTQISIRLTFCHYVTQTHNILSLRHTDSQHSVITSHRLTTFCHYVTRTHNIL
jgi:hypothetical protein